MNLNAPESDARRAALERLMAQSDAAAAETIGAALWDSHWPVCDELASALACFPASLAVPPLVRALKARRHHIRSAAVRALARVGDPSVRAAIERLQDDPSYEVRQDVAEALHRFQPKAQHRARHQRG